MKPVALISVDLNDDYLFLIPIVCKSWHLQNFDVEVFINGYHPKCDIVQKYAKPAWCSGVNAELKIYSDKNPNLYTQVVRLYMPRPYEPYAYLIISDADMFIASSFLYRDFDKINVFGHDLTGRSQIPMCYVGMTREKWGRVMQYRSDYQIEIDVDKYGKRHSDNWYEAWGVDQDIITGKLQEYGYSNINFIDRGHDQSNSGLPMGRWDRFNWKKPQTEIHDVHLPRMPMQTENFKLIEQMCNEIYPDTDWSWLNTYRNEYINARK